MIVFNTNQARHLYVATSVGQIADASVPTDVTSGMTNGQLKVGAIKNGSDYEDMYFVYKNGDGIVTRSDAIKLANIEYMNWVAPANLAYKLRKATVVLDTNAYSAIATLAGKEVSVTVNLREFIGLEGSENYPITVVYQVPATAPSATNFYKAIADALTDAIASFKPAPFTVTSSASGVVITEAAQKWVRGRMSVEPIHFEVSTGVDADDPAWATVTYADSGSTVTGDYKVADLEYFTHRERADILGESAWPYNYDWTPLVTPVAGTSTYGILTIQYFYAGVAEDVQKSPRTMHIACSATNYTTLKGYIDGYINPSSESNNG